MLTKYHDPSKKIGTFPTIVGQEHATIKNEDSVKHVNPLLPEFFVVFRDTAQGRVLLSADL